MKQLVVEIMSNCKKKENEPCDDVIRNAKNAEWRVNHMDRWPSEYQNCDLEVIHRNGVLSAELNMRECMWKFVDYLSTPTDFNLCEQVQ